MIINIHYTEPAPPINSVTITLTPQEAKDLMDLSGRLSTKMIADLLRTTDTNKAYRLRTMVGQIYDELSHFDLSEV